MKRLTKTNIVPFFRITILTAIIGCCLTACGETPEKEKTLKGTITADKDGEILFMFSRASDRYPESCAFTTNLPDPDDQFILTVLPGETAKREIDGLTAGQKVTWTAKIEGKPLNHGSGNFVHIINE